MGFMLERIESKIEFFEAYDLATLEKKIAEQIENNRALLLDVYAISHTTTFHPLHNKMLYSAVVHFKGKQP
ncbi:YrzA family protein [Paenibacillus sp.]|uniref:YrzA family protein n=1 Tax=Paenibacillus sp. TaxID=58172 RepID=UPI002812306A|nr:YrzA family protein [Paenibacillus sp.]